MLISLSPGCFFQLLNVRGRKKWPGDEANLLIQSCIRYIAVCWLFYLFFVDLRIIAVHMFTIIQ